MKYIYLFFIPFLTACFSLQKNSFGTSEAADQFANKIIAATNQEHWENTKVIQWTFEMGNRSHIWDRNRKLEYVYFGDYEVWMSLQSKKGIVKKNGCLVSKKEHDKYLKKAYSYWINDSFWLNPIAKFYDEGVTRSLVKYGNDTTLLVSYNEGGLTPGDSYLWLVDENYKPKAWKLWVSIIPIKGLEFSWQKWDKMDSGVAISTKHESTFLNVNLSGVKGVKNIRDLFVEKDPFDELCVELTLDK